MPRLRFTVGAWAKMQWLRDRGDTEVGMYGISSEEDPLLIERVEMVPQECTSAWCEFKDAGTAEFVDRMAQQGVFPARCSRVWIHTHPGSSPIPSGVDEATFERTFGAMSWAVMFILAKGGDWYGRVRVTSGGVSVDKEVCSGKPEIGMLAWEKGFPAADTDAWEAEYQRCWSRKVYETAGSTTQQVGRTLQRQGWRVAYTEGKDPKKGDWWTVYSPTGKETWDDYVKWSQEPIESTSCPPGANGTWVWKKDRKMPEFVVGLWPPDRKAVLEAKSADGERRVIAEPKKLITDLRKDGLESATTEEILDQVVEKVRSGDPLKDGYVQELRENGDLQDLLSEFGVQGTLALLRS